MRPALALLALVCACRGGVGLQGAGFPCQIDAGLRQCLDGWVCRGDGRCHLGDEGGPYACGGDVDCATGWRCGRSGRCQSRSTGAAVACVTEADCEAGWRCGLDAVCFDPAGPFAARACGSDLQCTSTARCGLEGVCRPTGQLGDWQCAGDGGLDDAWCEAGWRCGLDGRCVDPALDGFADPGALPPTSLVPIGPLLDPQVPVAHASFGRDAYALLFDGGLLLVERVGDGDAGQTFRRRALSLPAPGRAVELSAQRALVQTAAGVYRLELADAGWALEAAQLTGDHLRSHPRPGLPGGDLLVSWSGTRLSVRSPAGARDYTLDSFTGGAPQRIVGAEVFYGVPTTAIYALGPEGLAVAEGDFYYGAGFIQGDDTYDGGAPFFRAVVVPDIDSACGAQPGAWRAVRLHVGLLTNPAQSVLLEVDSIATGRRQLALLSPAEATAPRSTLPRCVPEPTGYLSGVGLQTGPCDVCPSNRELVDAFLVEQQGDSPAAFALCRLPASGARDELELRAMTPVGTRCTVGRLAALFVAASPPADVIARFGEAAPDVVPAALSQLNQWVSLDTLTALGVLQLDAPVLAGRPDAVARGPQGLEVEALGAGYRLQDDLGFVKSGAAPPAGPLATAVELAPGLIAHGKTVERVGSTAPAIAQLSAALAAVSGPSSLTLLTRPDGGQLLVGALGDALITADVLSGGTAVLERRATVQAQIPILSVAAQANGYVEGLALARTGLWRFRAPARDDFRVEPVDLPPGAYAKVWSTPEKLRVGYADGRIYGLPTRRLLAGPLDGGVVHDFAELCGRPFALATTGLYRLDEDAAHAPTWSSVDLSALERLLPAPPTSARPGRLFVSGTELWVFTGRGAVARLSADAGCR